MILARPWEDAYRQLLDELEKRWSKASSETAATDVSRWDSVAWNEYPGFSGERDGEQIYVSFSADLLSLSVFRPLEVHVVIRPEGFVDRFLKTIRFDWEFQTGSPIFDHKFYIEQANTDNDKRLVCDPVFQKLVEKLEPFVSVAAAEKGVHLSLAVESDSQLTVESVNERLDRLSRLAAHAARLLNAQQ